MPGGGVALARASQILALLNAENHDQKFGIEIVRRAVPDPAAPDRRERGARDGAVIGGKVLENSTYGFGYDAQTGEYKDLVAAGIIDPTKVVRVALQNAASVAGPADHHRGDGGRTSGEARPVPAVPAAGRRHGRYGLLELPS